jgi:hypothetical protein
LKGGRIYFYMAKKKSKIFEWAMWILGIIIAIGISGLFINGTFTNVIILSWLPLIVHQIVGYIILITTLIGVVLRIIKYV